MREFDAFGFDYKLVGEPEEQRNEIVVASDNRVANVVELTIQETSGSQVKVALVGGQNSGRRLLSSGFDGPVVRVVPESQSSEVSRDPRIDIAMELELEQLTTCAEHCEFALAAVSAAMYKFSWAGKTRIRFESEVWDTYAACVASTPIHVTVDKVS